MRMAGSPVRQFDPYTRPRLARWPIPGRLSQCLLLPVHVWLTAKLGADVPAETSSGRCCMGAAPGRTREMANTAESGFSPVRQFDPYTRPRLARWPIPGRLSQCLLLPVHVWLTAKLGADVHW